MAYLGGISDVISIIQQDVNAGITDWNRINNDITAAGAADTAQQNQNTVLLIGGLVVLLLLLRR